MPTPLSFAFGSMVLLPGWTAHDPAHPRYDRTVTMPRIKDVTGRWLGGNPVRFQIARGTGLHGREGWTLDREDTLLGVWEGVQGAEYRYPTAKAAADHFERLLADGTLSRAYGKKGGFSGLDGLGATGRPGRILTTSSVEEAATAINRERGSVALVYEDADERTPDGGWTLVSPAHALLARGVDVASLTVLTDAASRLGEQAAALARHYALVVVMRPGWQRKTHGLAGLGTIPGVPTVAQHSIHSISALPRAFYIKPVGNPARNLDLVAMDLERAGRNAPHKYRGMTVEQWSKHFSDQIAWYIGLPQYEHEAFAMQYSGEEAAGQGWYIHREGSTSGFDGLDGIADVRKGEWTLTLDRQSSYKTNWFLHNPQGGGGGSSLERVGIKAAPTRVLRRSRVDAPSVRVIVRDWDPRRMRWIPVREWLVNSQTGLPVG